MELLRIFSVVTLTLFVVHSQSFAGNIHLTESIEAQFGLLTSTLQVDHSSDVYFVEKGKDIYFRCIQREQTPSCGIVLIYFNDTLITKNGVFTNSTNTQHSYQGQLNGIEFLRIKNVTQNDRGRYSCVCRQTKSRTLFGANIKKNDVVYKSSMDVIVIVSLVTNHTCISNSSDVIINDTIEFKCVGNDTFLYFENSTKSSNLKAVILQATEPFNNSQIYCLGHQDDEICSFDRLKIHTRIHPDVTFAEGDNHTFEFTCASLPRTRSLTWDISTANEDMDLHLTVHYFGSKSILKISNVVHSLYANVTCTATIREHTASMSWIGVLSALETTSFPADEGINLHSQGLNIHFVLLWTFVCACSLFAFLFLLKIAFIFCKNTSEKSQSELKCNDRESLQSATTTVNNSTGSGTIQVTIPRYVEPMTFIGESNIEQDVESFSNSSFLGVRLDNETNDESTTGTQETSDSDVIIPPVAAPRVNIPMTPIEEGSRIGAKKKRFISKSVSARVSSRRPSLFEDDNYDSLMTSRVSLGADDSCCQDDEEWIRSKSYEALPFGAETFIYKPTYGIRVRLWDWHSGNMSDRTEEPIYAIPNKRKKKNGEGTSSTTSDQLNNLAHAINLSKFPPNTSPNVSQLRLNRWRNKKN